MKKLLLILVICMPLFCLAQTQDSTNTDDVPWAYPPDEAALDSITLRVPNYYTSGDLVQRSAWLRLSGFTVGVGTSTLFMAGAFNDLTTEQRTTIGVISGIISLGLYITGEITLIQAGKEMNHEAVTLSAASEGIGLAINF